MPTYSHVLYVCRSIKVLTATACHALVLCLHRLANRHRVAGRQWRQFRRIPRVSNIILPAMLAVFLAFLIIRRNFVTIQVTHAFNQLT